MTVQQQLLKAQRENLRLRNALVEMLTEDEAVDMDSNWWVAVWPSQRRLCGMLARYIREQRGGEDLDRYKEARRALGLPWWGGLQYEDGLQPGRGSERT